MHECRYAEYRDILNVMLSVNLLNAFMLSVVMLNVIMLSVVMLNVVMLSVIMLNVVMLSVVAPKKVVTWCQCRKTFLNLSMLLCSTKLVCS